MAGKYYVKKTSTNTVVNCSNISSFSDYLSYLGITSEDVDVTKLISTHGTSNDLNAKYFDNSSGTEFTGSIYLAKAAHEGSITFPYIKCTSNAESPVSAIMAGTSPHFTVLKSISTPGEYTISRTSSSLTIGSETFGTSSFTDGVIPLRLIVVLQGAGGGGGGNGIACNGSGGGGGAYYAGVINLAGVSWTLTVGKGGAGGGGDYHASNYNKNYGGTGGATKLTCSDGGVITAGGGGGGYVTVSGANGGSGGTVSTTSSSSILNTISYSDGKAGGYGCGELSSSSKAGGSTSAVSLYCTSRTGDSNRAWALTAYSGGSTDGNSGGGGGASWYGSGGSGASGAGDGGGCGAGGGGASWNIVKTHAGGAGGDGYVTIFY